MKKRFKYLFCIFIIGLMAFGFEKKKIKVYLIGDSTMANKEIKAYPETGWGMPFAIFLIQQLKLITGQRMAEAQNRL